MNLLREALISLLLAFTPGALTALGAALGGSTGFWLAVQIASPASTTECGTGPAVVLLGLGVLFMLTGACIGGAMGLVTGSRWCDSYELRHPPSELEDLASQTKNRA
jgi:hypothetical protein